ALAHHRRREGLAATSVQWGAFSEVGLAAAEDRRGARLAERGIASLTPAEGLDVLRGIVERPPTEIGVLKLDVGRWLESHPRAAPSPFYEDLRAAEPPPRPREHRASDLAHALRTAAPTARLAMLRERATEDLRVVLRLGAGPVDEHTPFKALGLDSLMSL